VSVKAPRLIAEALAIAPPDGFLEDGDGEGSTLERGIANLDERAELAPEPLPMPTEEERFAGLEEADVAGWPLRRGRLSASAIAKFLQCPEAFRRSYVLGDPTVSQGKMVAGTAAHATVEAAIAHALAGGGTATADQLAVTYDASFDAALENARTRGGVEWGSAEKRPLDADSARAIGANAVAAYAREALPQVIGSGVEAVEHVFVVNVPGCPVPVCGLIDIAGSRSSIDTKFGEKSASSVQSYWRIQAQMYGLARRLPVDFHTATWAGKVQTPTTHPGLRYAWSATDVLLASQMIATVCRSILMHAETFGRDAAWPGAVTHPFCSSCDYQRDCAWWHLDPSALL
jgi:hypothetical protein